MGCLITMLVVFGVIILFIKPIAGLIYFIIFALIAFSTRNKIADKPKAIATIEKTRKPRRKTKKRFDKYVVIDIETTGLSPGQNSIIEVAAIKVEGGMEINCFQTLVNPDKRISPKITKMTGITTTMVKDAPRIDQALPEFIAFLGDWPVVGHNINFDLGFILHEAKLLGLDYYPSAIIDTLRLGRAAFADSPNHKLDTLIKHCGITVDSTHRAMPDVRATAELYRMCCEKLNLR